MKSFIKSIAKRFCNSFYEVILKSVLAGIFISIGGIVYLSVGGGIMGSVLFSVGLISVIAYDARLFTGTAGFVTTENWIDLFWIIIGNLLGVILAAGIVLNFPLEIRESAYDIIEARLELSWRTLYVTGIGCGILMTTAVEFARKKIWIPLLFAVPVFILCGFPHCIADAFYFCVSLTNFSSEPTSELWEFMSTGLAKYPAVVLGNFIGCNVPRFLSISVVQNN